MFHLWKMDAWQLLLVLVGELFLSLDKTRLAFPPLSPVFMHKSLDPSFQAATGLFFSPQYEISEANGYLEGRKCI